MACIDSIHVNSDVKTVDRFSKGLWGGGISNFSYVDPKLLKGISTFCQLCRLDFHLCVLKNIIEVPRLEDLYIILICVFLGWLNSLRVLIGQLKLGIKVFACTFYLSVVFGVNPMATKLRCNLFEYIVNIKEKK
ncbi:MAG: hypothetical protein ACUVXA_11050 [Candidatus Jordarchaeum sp.]|uniref:hypothetical protein n=1 Tax=Candidatus Jordarchaeum sp. TaxID=2823881 RepID=UPI00404934A5